jgi:hypothetical protein
MLTLKMTFGRMFLMDQQIVLSTGRMLDLIPEGRLDNTTGLLVNDVENVTSNSIKEMAEDETNETADDGELENGLSLVTDFMLLIVN